MQKLLIIIGNLAAHFPMIVLKIVSLVHYETPRLWNFENPTSGQIQYGR